MPFNVTSTNSVITVDLKIILFFWLLLRIFFFFFILDIVKFHCILSMCGFILSTFTTLVLLSYHCIKNDSVLLKHHSLIIMQLQLLLGSADLMGLGKREPPAVGWPRAEHSHPAHMWLAEVRHVTKYRVKREERGRFR